MRGIILLLLPLMALIQVNALLLNEMREKDEVINRLEVYDLETRSHKTVREFPYRIEAPNWSPDGTWIGISDKCSSLVFKVPFHSGQGTINVNSWAPDSKKFTFVSCKQK